MFQRLLDRSSTAGRNRSGSGRRDTHPVLALQRLIGNHRTTQVIARDRKKGGERAKKKEATLAHQVRVGDLGPIEIEPGAVADWVAKKKDAGDPVVSSKTGEHSEQLKALADKKGKIDKIEFQEIVGENTWVIIRFRNARIRGYSVDGETEHWTVVGYDEVNREQTSIGKAR